MTPEDRLSGRLLLPNGCAEPPVSDDLKRPVGLTTANDDSGLLTGSEPSLNDFDFCKSVIQLGVWVLGEATAEGSGLANALSSQLALVGLQRFGSIVLDGLVSTVSVADSVGELVFMSWKLALLSFEGE
jgi:hypothetical protein